MSLAAEARAPLDVGLVDHVAVSLDVAVLAADDEDDEIVVSLAFDTLRGVVESTWKSPPGRVSVLALDDHSRLARVDEVELVLGVVVVEEALVRRRIHRRVDAERRDTERLADLAEAVALAELVERAECMSHGLVLSSE